MPDGRSLRARVKPYAEIRYRSFNARNVPETTCARLGVEGIPHAGPAWIHGGAPRRHGTQVLSSTLTVLLSTFEMARSVKPSPSRSAAAIDTGRGRRAYLATAR